MSAKDNARIAQTIFEAWNDRDFDRGLQVVSEDCEIVEVATGETFTGPEGLRDEYTKWATGLPDGRIEVRNVVSSGDCVAIEAVVRGTHSGPFSTPTGALEPTGRRLELEYCTIARIKDGKEVEERHYFDVATMMAQLGGT